MLIRSLCLEDFRQFRGEHTIDLSVDWSSNRNIILIGGLNGTGKTTLLEALRLAFFGRLNSDLWRGTSYRAFIKQCLNRASARLGKRSFRIAVEIENGEVYGLSVLRLERNWSFDSDMETEHETLRLIVNGKEKIGLSQEDAELYILERFPYELSQFVFFDGEKLYALARQSVLGPQVTEALESVLGVRLYRDLRQDLTNHLRYQVQENSDDEEAKYFIHSVDRTKQQLEAAREKRDRTRHSLADGEHELAEIRAERKRLGNLHLLDRTELDTTLAEQRGERDHFQRQLAELVSYEMPMFVLMPKLRSLRKRLDLEILGEQEQTVHSLLGKKKDLLLDELRRSGLDGDLHTFEAAWNHVFSQATATPVLRHKHLSTEEKYGLVNRVDALEGTVIERIEKVLAELERSEQKVRKLQQDIRALPSDGMVLDLEKREADTLASIRSLSQELGVLSVEEGRLEHELAAARRGEEATLRRLKLTQDLQRKVDRERRVLDTIQDFIQRLATAKNAEVQRYLTRMFSQLNEKEDMVREFVLDYETGSVELVDTRGNPISVGTLSEGEKETFALALLWGVNRAAVQELPMVIDTPLARLDSAHRRLAVQRFLPEATRQTIVLSTDSEVDSELHKEIAPYVAREFRLVYDATEQTTRMVPGYFEFGGDGDVYKAISEVRGHRE